MGALQTPLKLSLTGPTSPADHFAIIHLAREVGALWILPTAVYYCCRYDPATILECAEPALIPIILAASATLRSKHLPLLDHLATPLSGNNGCSTRSSCALARVRLFITRTAQNEADQLAPITEAEWDFLSEQACDQCLADTKKLLREWRLNIWENVPEILGLPSWEELEHLKTEDLVTRVGPPVNVLPSSLQRSPLDISSDSNSTADCDDETVSIGL
jgi:hypothetical protein